MCPAIHINSRSWLRSSSTHEPSDPPPRVVFGLSRSNASPSWVTEVAGKTVENQASKVLSSSQGGQALGGEDQLRIFHRERAGESRSPATRAHRQQADGTREATESLDLPPGGDRYLHRVFEGTVTRPEPLDPRRRDREAAAPAGGGRLDSHGRHQVVRDCVELPQFQDHCRTRRPPPAAHVPSKGMRRVDGHCCETVGVGE
ncbi:UNVERIFIED_CONTAM: hypothetical protein FKN15_011678 [Acipenser sinensis]